MKDTPRITIKQMATQLGVSHTTVSLALREHPSIPQKTRERIKKHAAKVGYHPDPMLSSLVAYRQKQGPHSFKGTLAWLTNYPGRDDWKNTGGFGYFIGAQKRAESLGYSMDVIWLNEPDLDNKRLRNILRARNIRGLLFAPQPHPNMVLDFDLDGLAGVTFGYSLVKPELHVVMNHQFRNMIHLVEHLAKNGIKKVGFAMPKINDERVNHNYIAGYWAAAHFTPGVEAAPYFLPDELEPASLIQWYEEHRPEVILTGLRNGDFVRQVLKEAGYSVPEDVGIAMANVAYQGGFYSGIDENHEMIGATAVNILTSMLYRNEYGLPENPRHTLIDGVWREGKSIRYKATK